MRRVPSSWAGLPGPKATGRAGPKATGRAFVLFALGSIGTFVMAARAVHLLDGPPWLGLIFAAAGLGLAGYYLLSALLRWRRRRGVRR